MNRIHTSRKVNRLLELMHGVDQRYLKSIEMLNALLNNLHKEHVVKALYINDKTSITLGVLYTFILVIKFTFMLCSLLSACIDNV